MNLAQVVADTRRRVLGPTREELDRLNGALTAAADQLTVTYGRSGIQQGSVLAVGLELMYVWDVSSTTVTVERGYAGSTARAHDDNQIVYVNSRVAPFDAAQAVNEELDDLSSPDAGLYAVETTTVTFNAARQGYDLDADDILTILEVHADTPTGQDWPKLKPDQYRFQREADLSDFASGFAFQILDGAYPGREVLVTYATPFSHASNLTDDIEVTTGLHREAHDILSLGAAARLVTAGEVARNDPHTQGDTRRSEEVPPGAVWGSARALLSLRDRRVNAERSRLVQSWGL